jgi:hypothetical protein
MWRPRDMASAYDFERLLDELHAAPAQCEARVILRQFYLLHGEDALSEQQIEQVTDIIHAKPE